MPILFIIIIYFLVKKKPVRHIAIGSVLLIGILASLVVFYFPKHLNLPDYNQLNFTIIRNGQTLKVSNKEQIMEMRDLLDKYQFRRTTMKTLMGVTPSPAINNINIFIEGNDFSNLLYISLDNANNSYLQKYEQYYSILNVRKFVVEVEQFTTRVLNGTK
ncbi:hypothetical protein [Cohnella yongneupensis]|uniref:Uncharacterized protein n=1 Tax=Cohnella yongneupensis TaxID=425006 RepID=A0ABW0R7S8_9BACL